VKFFLWIALAAEITIVAANVVMFLVWGGSPGIGLTVVLIVVLAIPTVAILSLIYAVQGVRTVRERREAPR